MRHRLWLLIPALFFAFQAGAQLAPQRSASDGVTIAVTPTSVEQNVKSWDFKVVFDTHTKDLVDDLLKGAVLVDEKGNKFEPVAWDGAGPGGHHREGILKFNPIVPRPASVELRILRAGETAPRTFRWQLN